MALAHAEDASGPTPGRSEGPDFLCIGMAKAGTGWLGDQLRGHPQFWMPPVQEIAYLGRDAPALRSANRKLPRLRERASRVRKRPPKRPVQPRDLHFLEELAACTGQPRDLEKYISLFRNKGASISGDISPGYATLEDNMIGRVATRLPGLRIVLLVRDPLQRLWSHISMWTRNGKFDEALLAQPVKFRAYLKNSEMTNERSSPTEVLSRWKRCAPQLDLRYFFFDDIATRPQYARSQICAFLGADPDNGEGAIEPSYNRKSDAPKLALTDAVRQMLIEHCADEIRACAREFGGWAEEWASLYGL